jgi:hypothetical protein
MSEPTTYECRNAACTLGTRSTPGRFTGGITAAGVALLTGAPESTLEKGKDYGEGICPNCGEAGKPAKEA